MHPTFALTIASLKMYYRNRQAIFWTLVLPLMFIVIFGLLNFGSFSNVDMGVVDEAETQAADILTGVLEDSEVVELSLGAKDAEMQALEDGDRDIVIVIPPGFGELAASPSVQAFYAEDRFQQAQVGQGIVQGVLDEITLRRAGVERGLSIEAQAVDSKGLEYVDFLVPGIISMAIMQMGIFSVVFSLIQFRQQGVLRRLYATPIRPHNFLIGQVFTRLLVSIVQVAVLLGVSVLIFDVKVEGNLGYLFVLAVLGGALFIAIGFVVSGFCEERGSRGSVGKHHRIAYDVPLRGLLPYGHTARLPGGHSPVPAADFPGRRDAGSGHPGRKPYGDSLGVVGPGGMARDSFHSGYQGFQVGVSLNQEG